MDPKDRDTVIYDPHGLPIAGFMLSPLPSIQTFFRWLDTIFVQKDGVTWFLKHSESPLQLLGSTNKEVMEKNTYYTIDEGQSVLTKLWHRIVNEVQQREKLSSSMLFPRHNDLAYSQTISGSQHAL